MNHQSARSQGLRKKFGGKILSVMESPRFRRFICRAILVAGFLVFVAVQSVWVGIPLWTRAQLPEPDDTLPFLVRTQEMEECFFQDCPALKDLQKQLLVPSSDPEVARQRVLAASPFHIYHLFFSSILLGLKAFGFDLVTAYRIVWQAAPAFFGLGFAYLLATLWGAPAAGLALTLLAFKTFPDNGLHLVVPSNLAIGIAVIVWARIISRRGDAPWALVIGSLAMAAMHPLGLVCSLMAALMALFMARCHLTRQMWIAGTITLLMFGIGLLVPALFQRPHFTIPTLFPTSLAAFKAMFVGAVEALGTVVIPEAFKNEGNLFGSWAWFAAAVVFGFLTVSREDRRAITGLITFIACFLFLSLFQYLSDPGGIFLRMWIPLIAVLFGAVGHGIWYALQRCGDRFSERLQTPEQPWKLSVQSAWPLVLLALFVGYCSHMVVRGLEQSIGMAWHMRDREPLRFVSAQPALLLSEAKPGDRVLYTSPMVMSYYFLEGAMRLGAVYYHPKLKGTITESEWLQKPDIRFAAGYNPTVYHPSFEGLDEKLWWLCNPEFVFLLLRTPRVRNQPLSLEGVIRASTFRWIEVEPRVNEFPSRLRVSVKNPGKKSRLELIPLTRNADLSPGRGLKETIPPQWAGWLEFDLTTWATVKRFRISLPGGAPAFTIRGIRFDEKNLHWPWAERARMTFRPKDDTTGPVTVSFDPSDMLPPPLNAFRITVLNDEGSSVLLKIDR